MYQKLIVAAALLLTVNGYAQKTKLALPQGKKYETTTTHKLNSIMVAGGHEIESNQDMLYVEQFEIKNTTAGNTDLVATISRMSSRFVGMGDDMTTDTDGNDAASKKLKETITKPRKITINPSGIIINDEGSRGNIPNIMETGIALFCASLIGRPFTIGASWNDSAIAEINNYKTRVNGMFTVKSVTNNMAVIAFNGNSVSDLVSEGAAENDDEQMVMTSKTVSKVTGEIKLDLATGIILESNSTSDGTMTVEVGGKNVSSNVKSTYAVKTKIL